VRLPAPAAAIAAELAEVPGAVAVVLGGSRATGTHRPDSDWDIGVYYRGSQRPLDLDRVRRLSDGAYVSELGEWGPVVNGGAWLTIDGTPIDVLFRDLDAIERWHADAQRGDFEVLAQSGYLAGAPTYLPVGELAISRPIAGELPRPPFPEALAATAPGRWHGRARLALMFAQQHARGGDTVCCTGMLANAVLCAAHARLAARSEWVLNEKRLVERAGLDAAQALLPGPGADLAAGVATVSAALGLAPIAARP
jgi:predicted nucleotidyltransferase